MAMVVLVSAVFTMYLAENYRDRKIGINEAVCQLRAYLDSVAGYIPDLEELIPVALCFFVALAIDLLGLSSPIANTTLYIIDSMWMVVTISTPTALPGGKVALTLSLYQSPSPPTLSSITMLSHFPGCVSPVTGSA